MAGGWWEHVARAGDMWQGVRSCGRGWGHLTRARGIYEMSKSQRC